MQGMHGFDWAAMLLMGLFAGTAQAASRRL